MAIRTWHKDDKTEQVVEKLRSYRKIKMQYEANRQLYESLYPASTARFTDEPHGSSTNLCAAEQIVHSRIDLSTVMERSLRQMQEEIGSILKMIEAIPENCRYEKVVIVRRYTLAESWETDCRKHQEMRQAGQTVP